MNYRRLGRYGISVSEVGLGGWLTHGRSINNSTLSEIVKAAVDLGINFFDTADVYNRGEAELALGEVLKDYRREDLVIATKCFFPMSDNVNDRGLSRKHIHHSVHASLKRLQIETIDVMQFHRFDPITPLDETAMAINDLVRQGKVLYWGVSEWPAHAIAEMVQVCKQLNITGPASNQPKYNMLSRAIEESVIPVSERLGLGQVVFSPLAQGVLTGKYRPGAPMPEGSRGADSSSNMFMASTLEDETLKRVVALEAFAKEQGHKLAEFSLAWCLRKANVSSVIVGATKVAQLEENAKASGIQCSDEVWAKAESILNGAN